MTARLIDPQTARRRLISGIALIAAGLAGCGGGGGGEAPIGAPQIAQFAAERTSYVVGERARLQADFSGGSGRIEPGVGAVASGASVETPVLDRNVTYRLIVTGADGRTSSRELALTVGFRDRYQVLPQALEVSQHAAVAAGDGGVLVIGGSRAGESASSTAIDRFDPVTRTFTRIGELRTGRTGHTATRLPDGRVLVVGGASALQIGIVADLIDERSGAVTHGGTLAQPRSRHTATLLADGRVLVAGGINRNTAELWDPATNTWRLVVQRMRSLREYHSATLLADGRVLIAGGAPANLATHQAEVFDPRTETFTPVPGAADGPRALHHALRLADGSVLLVGGEAVYADDSAEVLASALRFDPATGRLEAAAPLARARTIATAVALPADQLLLFGGEHEIDAPAATAESYGRAGGSAIAAMPAARRAHSATRLADGRVLIVGGERPGGYAGEVLLYE
ncbi:MAG: Kelch repeat-containing protein [Betaproteobacteria bacterium]